MAYADDSDSPNQALQAKAAMFDAMGVAVHLADVDERGVIRAY